MPACFSPLSPVLFLPLPSPVLPWTGPLPLLFSPLLLLFSPLPLLFSPLPSLLFPLPALFLPLLPPASPLLASVLPSLDARPLSLAFPALPPLRFPVLFLLPGPPAPLPAGSEAFPGFCQRFSPLSSPPQQRSSPHPPKWLCRNGLHSPPHEWKGQKTPAGACRFPLPDPRLKAHGILPPRFWKTAFRFSALHLLTADIPPRGFPPEQPFLRLQSDGTGCFLSPAWQNPHFCLSVRSHMYRYMILTADN